MDIITTVSQITTVMADMLIILPFVSRNIRRKLFRAIITDILYDIVSGTDGQTKQLVDTMKKVVDTYNIMNGITHKHVSEKDD